MNRKILLPVFLVPTGVLLIPAAAMFWKVEGWAWSAADFVIMWLLLAAAIAAYSVLARQAPNRAYRFAVGLAVTAAVLLFWVNGAVGIIGSEDNPANLLYGGVVALGLVGAATARLRPLGMARALAVTAAAQFLVPLVALIFWRTDFDPGVGPVLGLNFGFVLLFAGAALLFRQSDAAARRANIAASM